MLIEAPVTPEGPFHGIKGCESGHNPVDEGKAQQSDVTPLLVT
jgi:hypothetical protein